jgi:hypothetical protein
MDLSIDASESVSQTDFEMNERVIGSTVLPIEQDSLQTRAAPPGRVPSARVGRGRASESDFSAHYLYCSSSSPSIVVGIVQQP